MHEAAKNGHADILEMLLKAGADPSARNNYGQTPVDQGHADILEMLQKAGADPSARTNGQEHERSQTQAVLYNGHPYDRIINALEGKWYSKGGLNVPHLRELLAVNGKSTEGSRADLQERLEELMNRDFTPAGRAYEPRRGVRAAYDAKYGDGSFARVNLQEGDITEVRPGVFAYERRRGVRADYDAKYGDGSFARTNFQGVRAAFDAKYGDGSFARGNLQDGDITEVRPGVFEGNVLSAIYVIRRNNILTQNTIPWDDEETNL
jgi:hypothetical protein